MTQTLCAAPSCRIRGRHKPDCAPAEGEPDCAGCLPRVAEAGLVCDVEVELVRRALLGDEDRDRPGLVETAPAARDVAYGLGARTADGGASGKPGSRMQLDTMAAAKLAGVLERLTAIVDGIAVVRGITRPWFVPYDDAIAAAAQWLAGHGNLEWLRHRPDVVEIFADIRACARIVRGIVSAGSAPKYLGPCGADTLQEIPGTAIPSSDVPPVRIVRVCEGDVYGYPGAEHGTCRTCGAQVDQAERRVWLDEQITEHLRDQPLPARDIAYALRLNVSTIRTWGHTVRSDSGHVVRAAKLSTFWRDAEGRIVPWVDPDPSWPAAQRAAFTEGRGPRLHYVGDVQVLARAAAERRAQREAAKEDAA